MTRELLAAEKVFGWYGKIPAAGDFMARRVPRDVLEWWDRWMRGGMSGLRQQAGPSAQVYRTGLVWNFAIPAGLGIPCVQVGSIAASHDRVGRDYPVCATLCVPRAAYQSSLIASSGEFYRGLGTALLGALTQRRAPERLDEELLRAASSLIRHTGSSPRASAGAAAGDDILSVLNGHARQAPAQNAAFTGGADIMDVLGMGAAALGSAARAVPAALPEAPPAHAAPGWPDLELCFDPDGRTSYWWTNQSAGGPLQTWLHGGGLNTALFCHLFASAGSGRPASMF